MSILRGVDVEIGLEFFANSMEFFKKKKVLGVLGIFRTFLQLAAGFSL
jgi:hypothetical protein